MTKPSASTQPARKPGVEPIVALGLAAVLVFFLLSGALAWVNINTLRDDNRKIVHSHQVIVALDELLSTVKDAETGQRGFLLTDSERYLEPYNNALISVKGQLEEVNALTRDNPHQQERIKPLRLHIEGKLA